MPNVPMTEIDYARTVSEARAAKAAKEQERYSDFGRNHGGSDKLHSMLITAQAIAIVGAVLLTTFLTTFLRIDGLPALIIVVTFLTLTAGFDLVACALYFKRRVFLKLLGFLTLWLTIGAAVLAGIFYVVHHV